MTPLARFHKLDEAKKTLLLETAAAEFAEHGYEGASLNKIIESSSISKGAFYYYFADKLDLFVAVARYYFDMHELIDLDRITATSGPGEFWEVVMASSKRSMTIMAEQPIAMGLGRAMALLPSTMLDDASTELGVFMSEAMELMGALIVHGQRVGAIRTDLPFGLIMALWRANDEVLSRYGTDQWNSTNQEERNAFLDICFDIFRRLFSP